MRRAVVTVALLAALALLWLAPQWAAGAGSDDPLVTVKVERTIEGKPIAWWRARAVRNRRIVNRQRREIAVLRGRVSALTVPSVWDRLVNECESKQAGWQLVATGNGFYFGLQFHPTTWDAYRGVLPSVAYYVRRGAPPTRAEQIYVGERVLARQGWGAWPDCSRRLGIR